MSRFLVSIILALSFSASGHANVTPEDTVKALFDAMRAGDGAGIRKITTADARLDRLRLNGRIQTGSLEGWIRWVDTLEVNEADEQTFGVQTLSASPEFATVWAPFTIRIKGELKGCGINQFTLAKTAEGWRIVYGIDIPRETNCETYPDQFSK